jgi:hypothetical protein
MIRFLIRNTKTGEYLYRVTSSSKRNRWVKGADNASLITTASAASTVASNLIMNMTGKRTRYSKWMPAGTYPVEIIKVGVILIPDGTQPFLK